MKAGQFLKWMAGILISLLFIISCGTSSNLYFERITDSPEFYIDSLSSEHMLHTDEYINWDRMIFYTDDSVAAYVYTEVFRVKDSLYIMSVTETEGADSVILRFRREVE